MTVVTAGVDPFWWSRSLTPEQANIRQQMLIQQGIITWVTNYSMMAQHDSRQLAVRTAAYAQLAALQAQWLASAGTPWIFEVNGGGNTDYTWPFGDGGDVAVAMAPMMDALG